MSASPRTITATVLVKDRLQPFFQQHRSRGLGNSIRRIRHAERPDPKTMIFRYLHRAHRSREIATRRHPVPQPVEVVPLPPAEVGDTHGIHARRALIGPDLLPRPVDQALIDLKRLHLRLGSSTITVPSSLLWAGPPLCPASVLRHSRFQPLAVLPFAARQQHPDRQHRDDRFSCSVPAPATGSRHLYTGRHQDSMQSASWLRDCPTGRPLSREFRPPPVLTSIFYGFDASAVVYTCSSSRRIPRPAHGGTFRIAHDPGS